MTHLTKRQQQVLNAIVSQQSARKPLSAGNGGGGGVEVTRAELREAARGPSRGAPSGSGDLDAAERLIEFLSRIWRERRQQEGSWHHHSAHRCRWPVSADLLSRAAGPLQSPKPRRVCARAAALRSRQDPASRLASGVDGVVGGIDGT